jgi:hypothetical protein
MVPPQFVFPVFGIHGDIIKLWMSYYINGAQAEELGYTGDTTGENLIYIEYWDRHRWEIWINDEMIENGENRYKASDEDVGVVPYVYVPRKPTDSSYGKDYPGSILGTTRDFNGRTADFGDAINDASKPIRWSKNMHGRKINVNDYRDGTIIDLGDNMPDMPEPEIGQLPPPDLPNDAAEYLRLIHSVSMMLGFVSPVIFGIDEGSQRSAETLAMRALPTTTSIGDYRSSFTEGFNQLAQIIWRAFRWSDAADFDKPSKELKCYRLVPSYSPILPKDRQALITEESTLVGAGLRSLEKAIQNLGDVPDIQDEIERIFDDMERQLKLQQKYNPTPSPFQSGSPSGSSTKSGATSNASRPQSSTAKSAKPSGAQKSSASNVSRAAVSAAKK